MFYNDLAIANTKKNQPMIIKSPPIGVIAPNHLIFVILNMYKDPQKISMPIIKDIPA